MSDHDTNTTTTNTPNSTHTTTTSTRSGGGMAFILGAVVVVLVLLGFLLFSGDDADVTTAPAEGDSTTVTIESPSDDVTDVIEPGAADGGGDEPISLEENEAGTAEDPAIGGDTDADATQN